MSAGGDRCQDGNGGRPMYVIGYLLIGVVLAGLLYKRIGWLVIALPAMWFPILFVMSTLIIIEAGEWNER